MVAEVLILCGVAAVLIGLFLLFNSALVFNTARYMAVDPTILRREKNYIRQLPNILEYIAQAGYTSPWPTRPTAFAAMMFRRKLERTLKNAFPQARSLVQQHLGLWAFLQVHYPELRAMVREGQMRRASNILAESLDADERLKVLMFLKRCRHEKKRLVRAAPSPAITANTVHWLERLHTLDVIVCEHGYCICDELSTLGRWEAAADDIILKEIALLAS